MKLMSASTENALFDVYLTDTAPSVSVVRDDGHITATRWHTIREALAYLIGAGCENIGAADDRQLIEKAIDAKYSAFG